MCGRACGHDECLVVPPFNGNDRIIDHVSLSRHRFMTVIVFALSHPPCLGHFAITLLYSPLLLVPVARWESDAPSTALAKTASIPPNSRDERIAVAHVHACR